MGYCCCVGVGCLLVCGLGYCSGGCFGGGMFVGDLLMVMLGLLLLLVV